MSGTVYLVGIGPGNPQFLTVQAVEVLSRVSAVLSPAGVSEGVLAHAPSAVELFPESSPQENSELLIDLARRHLAVARLYFGDPFVLNPGPTETRSLMEAGVNVQVVPGLSAVLATAASAGVPLTGWEGERPVFIQRPQRSGGGVGGAAELIRDGGCVAFQGTSQELREALGALAETGLPVDVPARLVHRGSYPDQMDVVAALGGDLPMDFLGEAVLYVGAPTSRFENLEWFSNRPLFGKCIVVTRPRDQSAGLVAGLEDHGAAILTVPMIRIVNPDDRGPLETAARNVGAYDWVVFTSANSVTRFWDALRSVGLDTRALGGVSLCGIGPATAAAVEREGARVDLVPEEFVAESIVEALARNGKLAGVRILLPRAEKAREVLPDELRRRGAHVDDVIAYRTVPDEAGVHRLRDALLAGTVDVITFTSSSTVRNFAELVSPAAPQAVVASIGPITTRTARDMGWTVEIEAPEHSADGLTEAIIDYFRGRPERYTG